MLKNVAGQKIAVWAWDRVNGIPKTGDAANITAEISKDGGASAASDDTNPTELDAADHPGVYLFDLTQAESNADLIAFTPASSTSNIVFDPKTVLIYPKEAMRGTDDANTTTPPTVGEIQTEMEENGASLLDTIRDAVAHATYGLSAIQTIVNAIPTTAMRGTDNAALAASYTATRAGYLDELAAANLPSDIDAVLVDTGYIYDNACIADGSSPTANSLADGMRYAKWFATSEWRIDESADPDTMVVYKADGTTVAYSFTVYKSSQVTYRDPA